MDRLLRINMRTREYEFQDMGEYKGLGGRALTSTLLAKEIDPKCNPLGPDNKLVVAAGILAGTNAANSGRTSVGAKSPLTGTIKESNSGGQFSLGLAKLGIQAVVFEGASAEDAPLTTVHILKDKVEFGDAGDLAGVFNYAAHELLKKEYGDDAVTMLCGPAGERKRRAANIQFSDPNKLPTRSAGRGGLGAVMGSKRIKAVILDSSAKERPDIKDQEKFKAARKRWAEILLSHPVTSQGLPAYGTAILVNIINEAGALPTKNFREGRFEHAADISGEKVAENIEKRGGVPKEPCHTGCVIQCSQAYVNDKGQYMTSGFEYETIWAMGANTTIKELDDLAKLDRLCDELGLDTIEMGNAIAVAMDGGLIPWGDGRAAHDLLAKVGSDEPEGAYIGDGAGATGKALGVDRVAVVKNQSLPAYDPRAVKGVGVTYATNPMGADHTAGYAVCQNVLNVGGEVAPHSKEGQVELSGNLQVATAAIDSLGLCLFVAFAVLDTEDGVQCICDMVSALRGEPFEAGDFLALGSETLKVEHDFNARAGFTAKDDELPGFFKEPLPPHNVTWDFTAEEMQAAKG